MKLKASIHVTVLQTVIMFLGNGCWNHRQGNQTQFTAENTIGWS